ncbi:MAG: hypothetical protein EHM84_09785 [Lysobacterales bacterium]|nr:MAG: hypothetical protein EHM84_09785 [Xanthomonadales bacterium]
MIPAHDSSTPLPRPDPLPTKLPADPLPLFAQWFAAAQTRQVQPNPDAMVLATATVDGRPSARVVLLRKLVVDPGYVVFYTNYKSRKGRELDANPRAADHRAGARALSCAAAISAQRARNARVSMRMSCTTKKSESRNSGHASSII